MTKRTAIAISIAHKHHNTFKIDPIEVVMRYAEHLNVEGIVEQALSHVGGYDFIDGAHADFSDGTEAKTSSVTQVTAGGRYFRGAITNVTTPGGKPKSGDIRLAVYNEYKDQMDYFYLPWEVWMSCKTSGGPNTQYTSGKVKISYNSDRDEYQFTNSDVFDMNAFMCDDFEDLATITPDLMAEAMAKGFGRYDTEYA